MQNSKTILLSLVNKTLHGGRKNLAVVLFTISIASFAQEIKVNGGFLSDSLRIGEKTGYFLAIHYPSTENVIFPDSTFRYFPFEWEGKKYFPTRTNGGVSVDSAIYYLSTFEVDRLQSLQLPVFVVQQRDCTAINSPADSLMVSLQVGSVPDSISVDRLPLKMNTTFEPVRYQFNYWILGFVIGGLIVVGIIVFVIYGKRIRRYFITRRLTRNHTEFQKAYNAFVQQLNQHFSAPITESALSTWKRYMEQLESRPFTKLTTKETVQVLPDQKLAENLGLIDAAVYGHNTQVLDSLESLRTFAHQRFEKKIKEVKHG